MESYFAAFNSWLQWLFVLLDSVLPQKVSVELSAPSADPGPLEAGCSLHVLNEQEREKCLALWKRAVLSIAMP